MKTALFHTSKCPPRSASCLCCPTLSMLPVLPFPPPSCLSCISSALLTSDWIIARLSFWFDQTTILPSSHSNNILMLEAVLCLIHRICDADHFLLVQVSIPASRMNSFGESLRVNNSLVLAVLNSSTRD